MAAERKAKVIAAARRRKKTTAMGSSFLWGSHPGAVRLQTGTTLPMIIMGPGRTAGYTGSVMSESM
jgi:hypothetical protein